MMVVASFYLMMSISHWGLISAEAMWDEENQCMKQNPFEKYYHVI